MQRIGDILRKLPKPSVAPTQAMLHVDDTICAPDCDICEGIGYIRYDSLPLHHHLFGKSIPCPNVPLSNLYFQGHFGLRWDEQRSLSWDSILAMDNAVEVANSVRSEIAKGHNMIYLYGSWGLAKTMILKIAVAEVLRDNRYAHYINLIDLLDDIRLVFDEEQSSHRLQERVNHWSSIPFLAIDEFDKPNATAWVTERVFQIINRRYDMAIYNEVTTLIASNKQPNELPGYFTSRFRDGRLTTLKLEGVDARPGMERDD